MDRAATKGATKRRLVMAGAALAAVFLCVAFVMARGGKPTKATSGSIGSILKDVGHVVGSTRGVGIERY